MNTLRQEVAFNNVGFAPTCRITGSFLIRHALPAMVLCEARITQWLKCGYLEKHTFNSTDEGTPQGGIWEDYLNARWKRKQLSGVATRLTNA